MERIILTNPQCGLTPEEITRTAVTTSFAAFQNPDFWKAMNLLFNVQDHEKLVTIEVSEDGIHGKFKTNYDRK